MKRRGHHELISAEMIAAGIVAAGFVPVLITRIRASIRKDRS